MEKLELRARARAEARATGLFDLLPRAAARDRARHAPARRARPTPLPAASVDTEQARAACAPMGRLETVVQAVDAAGRTHALYVIVPDARMKAHYERSGLAIEPGCRVLLDAAALLPVAVLRMAPCPGRDDTPAPAPVSGGFNPYHDVPAA